MMIAMAPSRCIWTVVFLLVAGGCQVQDGQVEGGWPTALRTRALTDATERLVRADEHRDAGRHQEAIAGYLEVAHAGDARLAASARNNLALLYLRRDAPGDRVRAAEQAQEARLLARSLRPVDPPFLANVTDTLAQTLEAQGERARAIEYYRLAADLDPDEPAYEKRLAAAQAQAQTQPSAGGAGP